MVGVRNICFKGYIGNYDRFLNLRILGLWEVDKIVFCI